MKANPENESHRVSIGVYKPVVERIQKAVCEYYKIPVHVSQRHTRKQESILTRQVIHYFCREMMPNCYLHIIGMLTGNGIPFDHASVSHSHKVISRDLERLTFKNEPAYPELRLAIKEIELLIKSRGSNRKKRLRMHYRKMYRQSRLIHSKLA